MDLQLPRPVTERVKEGVAIALKPNSATRHKTRETERAADYRVRPDRCFMSTLQLDETIDERIRYQELTDLVGSSEFT